VASLALAVAAQLAPAGGPGVTAAGPGPLAAQALLVAVFVVWAALLALVSPLYMSFHRRTHAPAFDERGRVPITPPPGEAPPPDPGDAG
jgi:hypothetical protein